MLDVLQRPVRDLRISVTDRCNFRCSYCMPKEVFDKAYTFLPHSSLLSFEEITRTARLFVAHGVTKLRLTGGEPLLRKNLEVLIEQLATLRTPAGTPLDITLTTTDNDQPDASTVPAGHDWEEAGAAWSHRARDWACLFEHYATEAILAIFDRIGVGAGTSLLDIACGSGLALRFADARGATTAGIDAGAPLVDIARARSCICTAEM